jgi:hypothetical protein
VLGLGKHGVAGVAACAAALLASAGTAEADTFCVHATAADCTGEIDKNLNLSSALADAAASPENSAIRIRPGIYGQDPLFYSSTTGAAG